MIRYVAALAVAGLLCVACSDSGTDPLAGRGGGNDFPNSIDVGALGRRIAGNLGSYDDWNAAMVSVGPLPDPAAGTNPVMPELPSVTPRKRMTVNERHDSGGLDLSDTSTLGVARFVWTTVTDSTIKSDTVTFLWDDAARSGIFEEYHLVSLSGSTRNIVTGQGESYCWEDADGDGIIDNRAGTANRASFTWRAYDPGGVVTLAHMMIDAGPDMNLNTENDNRIMTSSLAMTLGEDTLLFYGFSDADGDSFAVDLAAESCVVDMRQIMAGSALAFHVSRYCVDARYVVFPADSAANYPIRLRTEEQWLSGRRILTGINGRAADGCFFPGDTAVYSAIVVPALLDTLSADTLLMTLQLGPLPHESHDDSLLSVYTRTRRRVGDERDIVFMFAGDSPVSADNGALSGTFHYTVTYNTGAWFELDGTFDQLRIDAVYRDSENNSLRLVWNRDGETLVEKTALEP